MIAITPGEPAGIGIDLICQMSADRHPLLKQCLILSCPDLLAERAEQLKLKLGLEQLNIERLQFNQAKVTPGKPNSIHAPSILQSLNQAMDGCYCNEYKAWVTGPIYKASIHQWLQENKQQSFSGHTEYIQDYFDLDQVIMLLASDLMKVALITTHLPISQVPAQITQNKILKVIRLLDSELKQKYQIAKPRIAICGLNPHAGEDGVLGMEEIEIINPAIMQLQQEGIQAEGSFAADTLFTQKNLKTYDAFVAMYHDQGLSVIKHASFGKLANITLGLPIIRTSVDHGTAFDLVGSGKATYSSLEYAIKVAQQLANK